MDTTAATSKLAAAMRLVLAARSKDGDLQPVAQEAGLALIGAVTFLQSGNVPRAVERLRDAIAAVLGGISTTDDPLAREDLESAALEILGAATFLL